MHALSVIGYFFRIEYIWLKNALFAPALARGGVDNKEESVYSVSWSTNLHTEYGEGTSGQAGAVD